MENPYKADDRVLIQRKGTELEAVVRTTWKHEVQVRVVVDRELLWRTVKTVKRLDTPDSPDTPASFDKAEAAEALTETEATTEVGQSEPASAVLSDSPDVAEVTLASEEAAPMRAAI